MLFPRKKSIPGLVMGLGVRGYGMAISGEEMESYVDVCRVSGASRDGVNRTWCTRGWARRRWYDASLECLMEGKES